MKINPITLDDKDIQAIVNIINRGNECLIKKERDNVVIIETRRSAIVKKPIIECE